MNEYDAKQSAGVTLEVTNAPGTVCLAVEVDGQYLAAYIGPRDVERLIEYLRKTVKGMHR